MTEPLGGETVVDLHLGGQVIKALTPPALAPAPGSSVRVSVRSASAPRVRRRDGYQPRLGRRSRGRVRVRRTVDRLIPEVVPRPQCLPERCRRSPPSPCGRSGCGSGFSPRSSVSSPCRRSRSPPLQRTRPATRRSSLQAPGPEIARSGVSDPVVPGRPDSPRHRSRPGAATAASASSTPTLRGRPTVVRSGSRAGRAST